MNQRLEKIDTLWVHATDTPFSKKTTKKDLYQWHVIERNWADIGYHFYGNRDGIITQCRTLTTLGAHTYGYNRNSLGFCFEYGGVEKGWDEKPTELSLFSFERVLESLFVVLPNLKFLKGHCDAGNTQKTCPMFDYRKAFDPVFVNGEKYLLKAPTFLSK